MGGADMFTREDVERCHEFHGHMCPGLAVGIRAAGVALERIGAHSRDQEVVAIVETDMCAVDGIQVLTGCTFGKGNLIHRDHGKNAFTFVSRSNDRAIRLVSMQSGRKGDGERAEISGRMQTGTADETDRARFGELQHERAELVLAMPIEEVFEISEVPAVVPGRARIHDSVRCSGCGESTMETRIRLFGGEPHCPPCFEVRDRR
jgi:formylmethanofuran dehydrogenase subunit E